MLGWGHERDTYALATPTPGRDGLHPATPPPAAGRHGGTRICHEGYPARWRMAADLHLTPANRCPGRDSVCLRPPPFAIARQLILPIVFPKAIGDHPLDACPALPIVVGRIGE